MASSRQELVGPKWESVSTHLGPLLGTGTFGMVFCSETDPAQAIKVSKSGLLFFIKNEAVILRSLAKMRDKHTSIPQLTSSGLLDVTIGGVSWKLPAIAMKPVGQGIYPILLSKKSSVGSIIDCILKDVLGALEFLHSKDFSHNDVSDRNILLVQDEGDPDKYPDKYRAVLVDFGVASQMYKKRSGLTGTPPFVHREVHTNYHWFPVPQYDKTSLGLTLVVILARGMIPWDNLSDEEDIGVYDKRIKAATTLLDEECSSKNLTQATADHIEELCKLDKQTFLDKCKCSKTFCGGGNCECSFRGCTVLCACYDEEKSVFTCQNSSTKKQQNILAISNDPFERGLFDIPSASP
jgi:serine/threonine protein kinase